MGELDDRVPLRSHPATASSRGRSLILAPYHVLGTILLLSCGGPSGGTGVADFGLREVQRYGWVDPPADSLTLPEEIRRADGGLLAGVVGVVQTADSTVYVLDQEWRKIVAFRPDGEVQRVILGGPGEGPGEFQQPVHLAATSTGNLAALDYETSRITVFAPDGRLLETRNVRIPGRPLRLVYQGNTAWLTTAAGLGSTEPVAYLLDSAGTAIQALQAPTERDRAFGSGVLTAEGDGDRVILTLAQPGVWLEASTSQILRRGSELYPEMEPPVPVQMEGFIRVPPAQAAVAGLGVFEDYLVEHVWRYTAPFDWDNRPPVEHLLALFTTEGELLDTLGLPDGFRYSTKYTYVSPVTGHVFIPVFEPYPMVLEYAIEEE